MTKIARMRRGSLGHSAAVIALLFGSMWLEPLYLDGIKSILLHAFNATLTDQNRTLLLLAAFSVIIPISYAWRRSRVIGAVVQAGILAVSVAWLVRYEPDAIRTWWSYAGVLFAVCAGIALLVIALMWLLAYAKRHARVADK